MDYPDNESLAICVVFMGCEHHCPNCHNFDFQDYDYKDGTTEYTPEELYNAIKEQCARSLTNKVVLTGGDVLAPKNILFTKKFLELNKCLDICLYTGYELDYVMKNNITGYKFLKCGTYHENLKVNSEKTDDYMQLASTNQKFYDENNQLLTNNGRLVFKK